MKNMKEKRIAALFLAGLLLLTFAACQKEEPKTEETIGTQTAEDPVQEPPEPAQQAAPEEEEVVVIETPEQNEPEPEGQPLSDGEYAVKLLREQTVDRNGTLWASFVRLHYVELLDHEVHALKPGDTVQLPEYSFVIESIQQDDSMGIRWILFNDGTERCFYIEETNMWRFTWPNDEPYLWDGEQGAMPLAVDVILTDELTPVSEGRNVYGVPAGDDPAIGALDLLEDFFRHYPGLEYTYATITVRNGEIAEVLIEYHP